MRALKSGLWLVMSYNCSRTRVLKEEIQQKICCASAPFMASTPWKNLQRGLNKWEKKFSLSSVSAFFPKPRGVTHVMI